MLSMIGIIGGMSHLFLTECYRHAPASVVAPFDYTAMIWAFLLGYFVFGELPSIYVYVGSAIVVACGLFVLWRERQINAAEIKAAALEGSPVIVRSKRLETDDRLGVLDAGDLLHLLIDEVPDVGGLVDIELHQQVELSRRGIDFGGDFRVRQRVSDLIRLAERAFDLDKKRNHLRSPARTSRRVNPAKSACRGKAGGRRDGR